jgi:signal transduction histidine kinase
MGSTQNYTGQKISHLTMEKPLDPESLRKSLIGLINTDRDFQTLLRQMAELIGESLDISACLLTTKLNSLTTMTTGFWQKENQSLDLGQISLVWQENENILEQGQAICLKDWPNGDFSGWSAIAPLSFSWIMTTKFHGLTNGIVIIGTKDADKLTAEKKMILEEMRDLIGIAHGFNQVQPELSPNNPINPNLSLSNSRERTANSPIVQRLYGLMRQQLEQQRQLNEMKDEIIAAISDRARNPLATMKMVIDALSDSKRQIPPASQENYWRILKQEWNTLNHLINNIVTLKQLESQEISFCPQPVDLGVLIKETTLPLAEKWREDKKKSLNLDINSNLAEKKAHLETDPQHLRAILQELLTNAANFSTAKTTVGIHIAELDGKKLSISVTNTGLAISEAEKKLIFEPFRRGQGITDRAIAGTGIGLALVKGLVELLNGQIEVTSEPIPDSSDYATAFTLILPHSVARNRPILGL